MELRFSRCSVALLLLLFVAANALRGPGVPVDEQKLPAPRSRGSSRFNAQSAKIVGTSPDPTSTSKSPTRRGSSNRKANGLNSRIAEERTTLKSTNIESNSRNVKFEPRKTLDKGRITPSTIEEVGTTTRKPVLNKKGADRRYLPESSNTRQGRKNEEVTIEAPNESSKFQKGSFRPSSRQLSKNGPSRQLEKNLPSGSLDKNGPSVFSGLGSSETSRSRTGRKIQPTFSRRQLRTDIPASKRFASRRSDDENSRVSEGPKSRGGSKVNLSRGTSGLDSLPSGSENIHVDAPAILEVTKRSVSTIPTSSEEAQRQVRTETDYRRSSDRGTRSRGRSSSTESSRGEIESGNHPARGNLRRGSSRSSEPTKVTELPEVNRRSGNRFSKDEVDTIRLRSSEIKSRVGDSDSRTRGRRPDQGSTPERRSGVERGNRGPDSRPRTPEIKTQDADSRKRSRTRSRVEAPTTSRSSDPSTSSPEVVTVVPEVVATAATVGPAESELEASTIVSFQSGAPLSIMTSKSATTVTPVNRIVSTTTSRATRRESEGTTRTRERTVAQIRRASKEDFFNHGLGFRGRRPLPDTMPITTTSMAPTPTVARGVVSPVTTAAPGSQSRGNPGWTLHRRPYHAYSGAESSQVTMAEESTTTSGVTSKPPGRRGNKTFAKTSGDSGAAANPESLESENYPPDFKAKLAQLKNSASTPTGVIPTPKSTMQGLKKSTSSLFSARSKMKLENARKLVKPELLDEKTDLKTTPASIKERKNLGIEDEKKLENRLSEMNTDSSVGEESAVKPEWKPATPKKNEERSLKNRNKQGRSFTPKSRISNVQEEQENNVLESSTEVVKNSSEKSKGFFKSRSKSRVENGKIESDNSIGRGKLTSRGYRTPDSFVTTIKPKKTSPRRSVKNPDEEEPKLKSRKFLVSRYRNAVKSPASTEKPRSKVLRGSTTLNPIRNKATTMIPTTISSANLVEETTIIPITMKNYVSVSRYVTSKVLEEISTKRLKTSAFNDPGRDNIEQTLVRSSKKLDYKSKNLNEVPNEVEDSTTTKINRPTSRYSRKKTEVFKTDSKSSTSTSKTATSGPRGGQNDSKRREFRPRTATYRRHSEVPTVSVRSSTAQPNSIDITPKVARFQASSSPSPLLVTQEPTVNVKVSNDSNSSQQQSLGILGTSNRASGSGSNIFSPTRSVLLAAGNSTLLEQIRSTVAPLLGSLAARSPVFAGAYNNATNVNTAIRITPNGSPPRFSARYKGAEFFVRKPSINQSTVPPITSSSTPFTPIENSGLPPPIEVSSNGEPKIVTFYQALESATITNEQLKTNLQQLGRVAQVDRPTDNDPNGTNSSNNDTETITVGVTTASFTTDTTMTPSEITQSSAATLPELEATQSPEKTPTTSEPPTTSEMTTTSESSPPSTSVTPLLEISNQIQVATTTTSTTTIEAEDVTTLFSISDILNNDIGDARSERPSVGTTSSENLTTETEASTEVSISSSEGTSTTEASSTTDTDVFIVTPVTMESSTQVSNSETTTLVTGAASVKMSSASETISGKGTSQQLSNLSAQTEAMQTGSTPDTMSIPGQETESPTTQMSFSTESMTTAESLNTAESLATTENLSTTEILTTTETLMDSMAIEARFLVNSAESSTMPESSTTPVGSIIYVTTIPSTTEMLSATVSSTKEAQSTTISSSTEIASTTMPLTTEMPSITTSTEMPSITTSTEMSSITMSTTETSSKTISTTEMPSTTMSSAEIPFTSMSLTEMPSTTMSSTEMPSTTVSSTEMPSTTVSSTEMPSTTVSSTEMPSTTVSSTEMPSTTVSSTEIPSTTMLTTEISTTTTISTTMTSTSTTPLATSMPSTKVIPLTTTMPTRNNPTTIMPINGYSRFPKLQSFLQVLAQLGNPTTKSQVMQDTTKMTTSLNNPTPIDESTTPVGIPVTISTIFPRIKQTESDQINSTTTPSNPFTVSSIENKPTTLVGSNSSLDVEMIFDENMRTTPSMIDQTSVDSSTTLSNQTRIDLNKDEFMNMTQSWINEGDSVLPFDNDLLTRLMNVASKLFSKPLNATQSLLLQKTLENTNRSSLDKLPSLLGGFLDHTDRNQTTESTTAVDIDTTLAPLLDTLSRIIEQTTRTETLETTSASDPSLLISDSQTNNAQQTITAPDLTTDLSTDTFSTNSPQTQTASILDLYAMLSDLVTKAPTTPPALETGSRTQETTLTPSSTEQIQMVEETTSNTPLETTMGSLTTSPDSIPNPETVTPTVLTRFQDTTPATAQGTAGANMISSNLVDSLSTLSPTIPPTTPSPTTSTNPVPTIMSSGTMFPTSTNPVPTIMTSGTMFPITTPNLPTTTASASPNSNLMNNDAITTPMMNQDSGAMNTGTSSMSSQQATTTPFTNSQSMTTPSMITQTMTTPYLGRFGGSRITPAPRFSSSSSTTAPLRDYLVYGIYPNKTIVRKRPEDNLIDARNIDSPYVIFGIYPDGRLVRKFPNGTVIPDPPSNPVEVVFSLSTTTTTTNRPSPPVFIDNQANQGTRNQNAALSNNRSPVANLENQNGLFGPNDVDNGLSGNAISPTGTASPVSPTVGSVGSTTQKMVINAQNAASSVPSATSSSSANSNIVAGSNGSQQGGRIIQDRERDEATRTREAGGQRSSVYIGQDKFINYWTNDKPNTNPQVLNVKINSVSTASGEGSAISASKLPSFNLLPNSGTGAQVTAPPGFPWKDPLDHIFGITTNPPPISASVASNILDDENSQNAVFTVRPVSPFVEVFGPISTGASSSTTTSTITPLTISPTPLTTSTTPLTTSTTPLTTSTTPLTTSTTPLTTSTTTTYSPPRMTMPSGLFTTNVPKQNAFGTTYDDLAFLNTLLNTPSFGSTTPKTLTEVEQLLANKILSLALGKVGPTRSPKAIQPSNASPNLLIETNPNSESDPIVIDLFPSSTTQKSTPVTWKPVTSTGSVIVNPWKTLLNSIAANQILISTQNPLKNSNSNLRPVFNHPSTTTSTPSTTTSSTTTTTTSTTTTTTPRTTTSTTTTTTPRTTTTTTTTTTTPRTTTSTTTVKVTPKISTPTRQVVITAKPSRPRTSTTPAPRLGFGANLLRAIFGENFFGIPTTTPTPVRNRKPVTTNRRPATTVKPVSTTQRIVQTTERVVSNIQAPSSIQDKIPVTPEVQVSKEKTNANLEAASSSAVRVNDQNSKLTQSSTFSPEQDAKFLIALLNAAQDMESSSPSPTGKISKNDEAFLRSILSGQASVQPASSKRENGSNDAALLAALLKAEGIEPSTPANQLREQLLLAGLEKNPESRSTTTSTTTTRRTTTRPRPAAPTWTPSSTYPPPLFGGFNFGGSGGSSDTFRGESNSNDGGDTVRSQVVNAAIGVTRAFSQFLGGAIMGAAKQLQTFVGNGTRSFFS